MAEQYIEVGGLKIAPVLHEFVNRQAIPGTGLQPDAFWAGFGQMLRDLAPRNRALMEQRDTLQAEIDPGTRPTAASRSIMRRMKVSCARSATCSRSRPISRSTTANVDAEIAHIAGPQLVVPVTNARYALNAANARWGSLYDALYGTDAIPEDGGATRGGGYNTARGARVVAHGRALLDEFSRSPKAATATRAYARRRSERLRLRCRKAAERAGRAGAVRRLPGRSGAQPDTVLLQNHGLHIELVIDRDHPVGRDDPGAGRRCGAGGRGHHHHGLRGLRRRGRCRRQGAGLPQLARPDAGHPDRALREGRPTRSTRRLHPDRSYTDAGRRQRCTLPGRSLMLVRNVGHQMYTDAVLDADGQPIPERHARRRGHLADRAARPARQGALRNSRAGLDLYREAEDARAGGGGVRRRRCSRAVEDMLGLPRNTLKMGIMDEERRTSANLKACIRAAQHRVAFINTGFLDRTGDEIHTSMRGRRR